MPSASLISPVGYSRSRCGYCSPGGQRSVSKSSCSFGIWAHQLSPEMYDCLINRGWRRSGSYIYHPDMAMTCCPQYTIRLLEASFKPGKQLRRTLSRFNRWVLTGAREWGVRSSHPLLKGRPGLGKFNEPFDLSARLRLPEQEHLDSLSSPKGAHSFSVTLHTSSPPHPAVYPLYQRYQRSIHKDSSALAFDSFERFLCASPLEGSSIPYGASISGLSAEERSRKLKQLCLPETFGGPYHLLYFVNGEVVAFSVLDFLPTGVSSVYFCYEPSAEMASLGWGKLSALREANLVRDLRLHGVESVRYLYMGYYVHSCQKMRYKARLRPSELLDPATNVFHSLESLLSSLDARPQGYFPFASALEGGPSAPAAPQLGRASSGVNLTSLLDGEEHDEEEEEMPLPCDPSPPSFLDTRRIGNAQAGGAVVLEPGRGPTLFKNSRLARNQVALASMKEMIAALHGPGPFSGGILGADPQVVNAVGLVCVVLR